MFCASPLEQVRTKSQRNPTFKSFKSSIKSKDLSLFINKCKNCVNIVSKILCHTNAAKLTRMISSLNGIVIKSRNVIPSISSRQALSSNSRVFGFCFVTYPLQLSCIRFCRKLWCSRPQVHLLSAELSVVMYCLSMIHRSVNFKLKT